MPTQSRSPLLVVLLLLPALIAVQVTAGASESRAVAVAMEATATAVASIPTSTPTPPPTATVAPTATATATPSATPTHTVTPSPTPLPTPTLPEAALSGKAVYIDQELQTVFVFEDGKLIRTMPASTGRATEHTYTPARQGRIGHYVGTFSSFGTTQDEGWYLFKADGGILIHGAPYLVEDGVKVYQDLEALGNYPTSHGCIRLSPEDAEWFTRWGPQGAYFEVNELPERFWELERAGGG
ncbi:MAG: L,D-transpeptidase [Anaerolineae bacterium]|nr:L,D-transpeptidase [Anaerolineae bacterium]